MSSGLEPSHPARSELTPEPQEKGKAQIDQVFVKLEKKPKKFSLCY